ncbi:MAG: type II toxin-antitoxin system death-on-curing family toxin [Planctomycetota bacterium]
MADRPEFLRFLSVENVLLLHRDTVEREGGAAGILNPGMLDSAVAMPRQQFGGEYLHRDLAAMAAAYLFHLNLNHPFEDGNKRTSVLAATTFLIINGHRLVAEPDDLEHVTLAVAAGEMSKADLTDWVRERIKPTYD